VTILSPDPLVGKELQRTAADAPLRRALRKLGVDWRLEVSVTEWHGNGASIVDHNTGETEHVAGDGLVIASTNVASDWLAGDLRQASIPFQAIGDCAAPRQAPYAFHEGRKAGLQL
jgi:hypothetical protein